MFSAKDNSERATSIQDYQNTCADFIMDISKDYKDWVDRYQLSSEESSARKAQIDNVVNITNEWIYKYADTIKKVDIVMNYGINKMAENTAGYPFKYEVLVKNMKHYAVHPVGNIRLNIQALPTEGRLVRIGKYYKDQLLLINSSSPVHFTLSQVSLQGADILNDYLVVDATKCQKKDILSITIIVEEFREQHVLESRGFSTILLLL